MAIRLLTMAVWGAGVCLASTTAAGKSLRPNIMWMHVESTDGRLYNDDSPVPIPNIRSVQKRGVNFVNFYANVPICCPSRASVITGRQPHNIPHEHNGYPVIGALSNYEGLGLKNTTWRVPPGPLINIPLGALYEWCADLGFRVTQG